MKRTNQTEVQPTEVPNVSDEEQQTAETSTRKSPRIRTDVRTNVPTAQCSGKRKRPTRAQAETQTEEEPTPLPKFIEKEPTPLLPYEFCKFDLEPVLKIFEF